MPDLDRRIANLSPAKQALLDRKGGLAAAPALRPHANRDGAPLSFAQQRLWLVNELRPRSPVYNVPRALRLKGRLDVGALERSLNEILRRHEALRTVFPAVGGQPIQRILPLVEMRLTVETVEGADAEQRLVAALSEEYELPIDLATGPMLRARLWQLGSEEHVLMLVT